MKLSKNTKIILFICLIILNIILRTPPALNEVVAGVDSIEVHSQTNSISEFGYAKWVINPLSFFGLTPLSYTSAVPFFITGIRQMAGIEDRWIIYVYGLFVGITSIFCFYIFAGEIVNDDLFKFLASFGFSTSGAILNFTTWTYSTRGLLVALGPLLLYLMLRIILNNRNQRTYMLLVLITAILLFTSHHLFYFFIPSFLILIFITTVNKCNRIINVKPNIIIFMILIYSTVMFSIPFVFRKFIEESRFYPFYIDLLRYSGVFFLFSLGGIVYLSFKSNKSSAEWFILLNSIFLIAFLYQTTYFKGFASIYLIILACIGILNVTKIFNGKSKSILIVIIMISSLTFSAYYQFPNQSRERYMTDSVFDTGIWLKEYGTNSSISNDLVLGASISSVSDTTHVLTHSMPLSYAYDFLNLNFSEFVYYPVHSENFWYDVGKFKYDYGELLWYDINMLNENAGQYNISYVIEKDNNNGYISWNHGPEKSKLIEYANDNGNIIFNSKNINIYLI